MFIKSIAELVYVGKGVATNGSPFSIEHKLTIKCDEMETFSNQYYNTQERDMRTSRNLVIPTHYVSNIIIDNVEYELMFVNCSSKRYKVKNILKMRNTRNQMILDIQEVRP